MYQNVTEGKFKFFDENFSKSTTTYNLEPGPYTSITYIVKAMNTLIQDGNNHNETCISVKASRRTGKVVIMIAIDTFGLALCSSNLLAFLVTMWDFGVLVKGKGSHESEFD